MVSFFAARVDSTRSFSADLMAVIRTGDLALDKFLSEVALKVSLISIFLDSVGGLGLVPKIDLTVGWIEPDFLLLLAPNLLSTSF